MKNIFITLGIIVLLLFVVGKINAVSQDKVTLCHQTDSNTNPWVEQSVNANEVQSHLANGDFLITENTPCPPVVTPTLTPAPTSCVVWEGEFPLPCPTSTVTPTITPGQPGNGGSGSSDGRSDGLGCGSHDCSVHVVVPQKAPTTGRG